MKRFLLIGVLAVAALLPAAAPGAGCSPLSCAASGASIGRGLLAARPSGFNGAAQIVDLETGAVKWRLPSGILVGHTLVEQSASHEVTWHDAWTGKTTGKASFDSGPDTAFLAGVSQDGSRAVLWHGTAAETRVNVVSKASQTTFTLPGNQWSFDALSGDRVYLLRYLRTGYEIRVFDLATNTLEKKPLKDPKASSTIWGAAWERIASRDGRYLFTLYVAPDGGAMVHQLDLRTSSARCIDLPGSGSFNDGTSWALELSPSGKTLWAASPGFGRVVGIDVGQHKVRVAFRFKRVSWGANTAPLSSVSAMSPDGARIAVGIGGRIFYISLAHRTVVEGTPHSAIALGYAPDATTLWVVGKGEHVTALPAL